MAGVRNSATNPGSAADFDWPRSVACGVRLARTKKGNQGNGGGRGMELRGKVHRGVRVPRQQPRRVHRLGVRACQALEEGIAGAPLSRRHAHTHARARQKHRSDHAHLVCSNAVF